MVQSLRIMEPNLLALIDEEAQRQKQGLELIPSENYVSQAVRQANASLLTNKYSEGYPHRRYYGGQVITDQIEDQAIVRAKELFGADHANVQPHSGAQANEAVYHSWLDYGDTILAMDLSHGGHLTHGAPVTMLAKQFNFVRYKVANTETGEFDFDQIRELALTHMPKILMVGYSAYTREIDYATFAAIGNEVGALLVADIAHIAGLIAGGELQNPLTHGFHVLSSTTHKTLRGPRGGLILSKGTVSNPLKAPEKILPNIPTLIDRTVFPGLQGGPHMHTIAAKSQCFFEASQDSFKDYARNVVVNAKVLAKCFEQKGVHMVFGGTDNHMLLIDTVKSYGIDGAEAESRLEIAGLTANKNNIPDDANPPFRPSGLRIGTPAITTRGASKDDMSLLANWIDALLGGRSDTNRIAAEVREFSMGLKDPSTL